MAQASPNMDFEETINEFLPYLATHLPAGAVVSQGIATSGLTAVASAGTRVVLAPSVAIRTAVIQAHASNTGVVVFGGSGVVAAGASRAGAPALDPKDSFSIDIDTPAHLYLDSTAAADRVHFTFLR